MIKKIGVLFLIELRYLSRAIHEWLYPFLFFVIVISLFPLTLSIEQPLLLKAFPATVWIAALLASLLLVQNIFVNEYEEGHLEQLLFSRSALTLLIAIKLAAYWLLSALPLILLTPLLAYVFHLSWFASGILALTLLLGTPIFILLGSLGCALSLGLKQQGALLALIILPLAIPVLIFGANILQQAQNGISVFAPLIFFSAMTLLAMTFIPFAIAAALKISLEG